MKSAELKKRFPDLYRDLFGEDGKPKVDTGRLTTACERSLRQNPSETLRQLYEVQAKLGSETEIRSCP
jgi:hypothetical protein